MKKLLSYLLLLPLLAFITACNDNDDDDDDNGMEDLPTLVEAANEAGLTVLLDALDATELEAALLAESQITVFAPTNAAFTDLLNEVGVSDLQGLIDELGEETVATVLQYHVVQASALSSDLTDGQTLTTLAGIDLTVNVDGSNVSITDENGSTYNVTTADVEIENGVVHVINGVLLPEQDQEPEPTPPTISEALEATASLSTLETVIGTIDGLGAALEAEQTVTIFAPNNDAFTAALSAYGVDNLDDLITELGGIDSLAKVLNVHVVGSTAFAADLSAGQTLTTLAGQDLTVNIEGSNVSITDPQGNEFAVSTPDVAVENGVVHIIDGVLLPIFDFPTVVDAATSAGLSTLLDAVTAANLGTTLLEADGITVFAPTNDAFANLLIQYGAADLDALIAKLGAETVSTVLEYHVVDDVSFSHDLTDGMTLNTLAGEELTVNVDGANVSLTDQDGMTFNVTAANVGIENGVVHVIDGVLLPIDRPTVVEAAESAGLNTLLNAVTAADLGSTLLDAEAITVFAPTNDAFSDALDAYGVNNLDQLVAEIGGIENLQKVLGFHVVEAVAYAGDLAEGDQMFETLAGEMLTVNKSGATVTVTDANGSMYTVTTADVTIENGVVHVIDGVLLPTIELPDVVAAATDAGLTTLLDAVTAANLGNTLTSAEAITVFAPTNDAFADLLAAQEVNDLEGLIDKLGAEAVTDVLEFHVVPAVAFSHDLNDGDTFTTLDGETLTVNVDGEGNVTVTDVNANTFNVTTADVAIDNGVVHVIDGVLLPTL